MWLFRPDAFSVWQNEEVCSRYERYKGIIDFKKIPRYKLVKKIPIGISLDNSLTDLWAEHNRLKYQFIELLKKIDQNLLSIKDLKTPDISFLDLKEKIAYEMLKECHFCERRCLVNRAQGKLGYCRLDKNSILSSAFLHTGEESILVPSGTIFFAGCTFTCAFCQNFDISQEWCENSGKKITGGIAITPKKLALQAEYLSREGARNINLVGGDPTPNIHTIISFLKEFNVDITILWNSNMYQSLESTNLLLELMDFWLPDFKYWDNDFAKKMSGINYYRDIVSRNIKLAYQEGSGEVLIRHLIMPGRIFDDTFPILDWCAKETPRAMVNLMDQYHPDYLVPRNSEKYRTINRRISLEEWQKVTQKADELRIFWRPVS